MKIISRAIYLILFFLLLFVLTQNSMEYTNIRIFTWKWEGIPLFLVILATLVLGAFIGMIFCVATSLSYQAEIRRWKKENKKLREELDNIRNVSIDEIPDTGDEENENKPMIEG